MTGATIGPSILTACVHCVHTTIPLPNTLAPASHAAAQEWTECAFPPHFHSQYRRARRAGVISDADAQRPSTPSAPHRRQCSPMHPPSMQWKIGSIEMKTHPPAHRFDVVPPMTIQLHIHLVLVVCANGAARGSRRVKTLAHSTFHLLRVASRSSRGAEEKDNISADII
ncbi:hypothetical protein B0H16DRAFT_1602328 [Mycena metata]|uniref:Uncharacterized protein n=1 Tax=Mycena metata TaxID=1033252 RepID=A0AAD7MKH1_9AGAR|nr:hypothetical protein B0H16DRAFT_1602328 [Mycena metata]